MDAKQKILTLLEEAPRKRRELYELSGTNDRQMREIVEELRREGKYIIHNGKAYELTDDVDKIEKYLHSEDSRSTNIYLTNLAMRRYVAESKGQRITEVRRHFRRLGVEVEEGQERMEGI